MTPRRAALYGAATGALLPLAVVFGWGAVPYVVRGRKAVR